jgi:hypothetical protein
VTTPYNPLEMLDLQRQQDPSTPAGPADGRRRRGGLRLRRTRPRRATGTGELPSR